jgi:hypothetical protein
MNNNQQIIVDVFASSLVPEPASYITTLIGLALVGVMVRGRRPILEAGAG